MNDTTNDECYIACSLPRVYLLPRHFVYGEVILFSLIVFLAVFAWIPVILSFFTFGTILASALRTVIYLTVTAVSLLLFVFFIKREMRTMQFVLTDEHLMRTTFAGSKKIRLAAVQSVSLIRFPVNNGMMVVDSGQGTITVPLILQQISDLTMRIETICAAGATACPADAATWQKIHQLGRLSERAARRSSAAFKPLLITVVSLLPVSAFIGTVFWNMSIIPLMLWSLAGPVFPLCAFAAADFRIRLRDARYARHAQKNGYEMTYGITDEDKRDYARSGLFFFSLYLIGGIMYKALVP